MIDKGLFIYPWDVLDMGVERTVEHMRQLGCNRLIVNSSYHHARILCPNRRKIEHRKHAAASFNINESGYGRLVPIINKDIADSCIIEKTRGYCAKNQVDFCTWWVGLHNSSLGQENPDLCMQNVWGDRYTYALCPSKSDVQQYAEVFFDDTLRVVQPDRIVVESAAFLTFSHGMHHEIMALKVCDAAEWLLSLCFCDDCCRHAQEAGCDVDKVKKTVRLLLDGLVQEDTGDSKQYDIDSLMGEYPELSLYHRQKNIVVTNLVRELYKISSWRGVKFDFIPSSMGQPINKAYLEGVSLEMIKDTVNSLMPLAYGTELSSVHQTLQHINGEAPGVPVNIVFALSNKRIQSESELIERVRIAIEGDVNSINYYNYGQLNEWRLSWIRSANTYIDENMPS